MKRKTEEFHWIGETLMAKEFGEVVEICNVDWSGLDEFEAEHKCLMAAAHDLEKALEDAGRKLLAYVGVCKGDKELTGVILPQIHALCVVSAPCRKAMPPPLVHQNVLG